MIRVFAHDLLSSLSSPVSAQDLRVFAHDGFAFKLLPLMRFAFEFLHMMALLSRRSQDQICSRKTSRVYELVLGILVSEFRFTVFIP